MVFIPRQEALLVLTLVALIGCAWALARAFRHRQQGLSIRGQIFVAVALTTIVVTAGFGAIVVDRFQDRTLLFAHRAAAEDARIVSQLVERSMGVLSVSLAVGASSLANASVLYGFTEQDGQTRVQLVDHEGIVLFDTLSNRPASNLRNEPEVQDALAGVTAERVRQLPDDMVAAAVPIRAGARIVGAVRVTKSAFGMRTVLSDLAPKVALLALILMMTAAGVGLVIGQSISAPLQRLTQAADRIAHGERQATLPEPSGREVKELTRAFGRMRAELEQRDQLEALATNLSHELKNPVAAIRASAEVLTDAVDHDPKTAKKFAARVLEASERMGNLLDDLLALTRLEAQGLDVTKESVLAREIVEESLHATRDHRHTRQIRVNDRVRDVPLKVSRKWLVRAVSNLLQNATLHAPTGSEIRIDSAVEHGSYVLSIVDTGAGVPEDMRERVFERFVTTRQDSGGTGLGLAIVRAVAEAHGGEAGLRQSPAHTEFFISIPTG